MKFEYDSAKSASNKLKHGVDFEEAKVLWTDERRVVVPAVERHEARFMAIGLIGGKLWTAIYTVREAIRLISVRRARDEEVDLYEVENDDDR